MNNEPEIKTRPAMEIQRAHDMLVGIILGETPLELKDESKRMLQPLAGVLCWVLEHDHNPAFGTLLEGFEAKLKEHGFTLERRNN